MSPNMQKIAQGLFPLAKFSAKLSAVLLHFNIHRRNVSITYFLLYERDVARQGLKVGQSCSDSGLSSFLFISIHFLLAAVQFN